MVFLLSSSLTIHLGLINFPACVVVIIIYRIQFFAARLNTTLKRLSQYLNSKATYFHTLCPLITSYNFIF